MNGLHRHTNQLQMLKMGKSVEERAHGAWGCFHAFESDVLKKWESRLRFFLERGSPAMRAF